MKKILLVEDDQFIREIYGKVISVAGYDVEEAVDGLDGLEKIKSHSYDLILLDVMMPNLSGIELLRILRALDTPIKNTPVFMTTNTGQQSVVDESEKLGISGYIIKSQLTPQQLVEKIRIFFEEDKPSG